MLKTIESQLDKTERERTNMIKECRRSQGREAVTFDRVDDGSRDTEAMTAGNMVDGTQDRDMASVGDKVSGRGDNLLSGERVMGSGESGKIGGDEGGAVVRESASSSLLTFVD